MDEKFALNLAEDGRILSATFEKYASLDAVLVDALPDGDITDYRYVDGEYLYDPLPEPEPVEPEPSTEEILLEIAADHEERLCMMELGI